MEFYTELGEDIAKWCGEEGEQNQAKTSSLRDTGVAVSGSGYRITDPDIARPCVEVGSEPVECSTMNTESVL